MEDFITKEFDFNDVFILPQYSLLSSRSEVSLERTISFRNNVTWTGIPIIASNMDTTGTFDVYNVLKNYKMLTALSKFYTVKDYENAINQGIELDAEYYMVTTGITDDNFANLQEIVEFTNCKWICIDVANGYMQCFVDFCKKIRDLYPDKILVAGNVVTAEMYSVLVSEGEVDVVKIGIGSGSACLTRRQTGVGRPQLQAVRECSEASISLQELGYKSYLISDGGIKYPGDMSKAFGAGADFVMAGGVFAGHDENPGEVVEENGQKYKLFYGMSSRHAMEKYFGKMETYRSSEGDVLKIPYKGKLEGTIQDFLGGLRSTGTYIGAKNIEEFPQRTVFVGK